MITPHIIGGLGNQMFQYAAALGLAKYRDCGVSLDLSGFESYSLRGYLLDNYNIPQNIASKESPPSAREEFLYKMRRKFDHIFGTKLCLHTRNGIYQEPFYHFDEKFFDLNPPVKLYGYFQSPLYFEDIEDLVRERFSLRNPMNQISKKIKEQIEKQPLPISLHVRRGDYISDKNAHATHGTAGKNYYEKAVKLMKALYGKDIHLFMFSDDPDFVEKEMNFDIPTDAIFIIISLHLTG